jgi:hypothetical protein
MPYRYKREPLLPDEANRLANACQTHEEKLVARTLLDTSLRVSEHANLRKDSLDCQNHRPTVYGKGGPYGSRSKRRLRPWLVQRGRPGSERILIQARASFLRCLPIEQAGCRFPHGDDGAADTATQGSRRVPCAGSICGAPAGNPPAEGVAAMMRGTMAGKADMQAVEGQLPTRSDGIDSRLDRIEHVLLDDQRRRGELLEARMKARDDALAV